MDPQISFFINFFIKNGSYSTIHTFKTYFAIVFSVFNFQFQQNKFYPNRLYENGKDNFGLSFNFPIYIFFFLMNKNGRSLGGATKVASLLG